MSSVIKYKLSLEPAKHIRKQKTELGVRKPKPLESSSAEIIQSQTITSFCTTKTTNQIAITTFCTAKTTNQITISGFRTYLVRAITD